MKNIILYTAIILCSFISKVSAQETSKKDEQVNQSFSSRAKAIAERIETITKEEKAALKIEIEEVNVQLENGTITKEKADNKKLELAQVRATNIETKVAIEQEKLKDLVQQKVDGKIADSNRDYLVIRWSKQDSIKKASGESRTTSQFVFAIGLNNLATDGNIQKSDFKYLDSRFYEWGLTYNTRILKNSNLLHFKYGASVMYNDLKPTNNRIFVINGNQTNIEYSPIELKSSRFRNVYLVAPLHLEFDLTKQKEKDGKPIFNSHESLRFGFGGYAGVRIKSKQKTEYEFDDIDYDVKAKGDFNASDFIYGVSAYLGYKETSLYVKYDLNPLFKDNAIKQNNVSLGVRFDFN